MEWTYQLSSLIMMYLYLLLMYQSKCFILSVTIVSLLDFNNTGLGGPTVRGPAQPGALNAGSTLGARLGPFSFIKIRARPRPRATRPVHGSNFNY